MQIVKGTTVAHSDMGHDQLEEANGNYEFIYMSRKSSDRMKVRILAAAARDADLDVDSAILKQ